MPKPFDVEIKGSIAHIQFNRPEKRNSMNEDFWNLFPKEVEALDDRGDVRALIISSQGPHFTSGIDLAMFKNDIANINSGEMGRNRAYFREQLIYLQNAATCLEVARFPVITAIQGGCIGGGIDLISAADIRLCSKDAFFKVEEINVGLAADIGTLQRLPKIIPAGIAREWALTGDSVDADRAHAVGLVNYVYVSQDEMMEKSFELADRLASKSPLAMWATKENLNYARDHTVEEGLNYISLWNAATLHQEDIMTSMSAKMAKQKPKYKDLRDKNFLNHKGSKK